MAAVPASIQAQIDANTTYMVVGATIVLANLLVMVTFLSKSTLFNKYQLLIALAAADTIAGLSTLTAGYGRRAVYAKWPNLPNDTTVMDCVRAPWPPLLAIGGLWPAALVFAIGVERALAVFTPISYHNFFNTLHRWILIGGTLAVVLIGLAVAYVDAIRRGDRQTTFTCSMDDTFAPLFNNYQRTAIMVLQVAGFALSLAAFLSARRQSRLSGARGSEMKTEAKRIVALLAISGFSVLLVSFPMFILWGFYLGFFPLPAGLPSTFFFIVFNSNSLLGLFIYLLLKKEFRSRFVYLLTFTKLSLDTGSFVNVQPIAARTTTHHR